MNLRSRWFSAVLTVLIGLVAGCASPVERVIPNCPPPPQPLCKPGTFDKLLLDTLYHGPGTIQNRVTALPDGINGPTADNALTFVPSSHGLIAVLSTNRASSSSSESRSGDQRMYSAPFIHTTAYGTLQPIGNAGLNSVGAGFYSRADNLFYFSAKALNYDPDDYDVFSARIRESDSGLTIVDPQPVAGINVPRHFDSQPTLDPTGLHLFFASDRPGGMGGTDIWQSDRASLNSAWSEPKPLPAAVNTECDELSPYMTGNTLYFASNGHATVGGYDLFKAEWKNGEFVSADNIGRPYNTVYDEIFPVALNDTAFFWSSNAPTYQQGRNLFTITRRLTPRTPEEERKYAIEQERLKIDHLKIDSAVKQQEVKPAIPAGPVNVYVRVTQGPDRHPASGADLYVRNDSIELYRGLVPPSGNFLIKLRRDGQYDIGAETEQSFFDVQHLDLRGSRDTAARVDLNLPDTLVLRINFPFDDYQHPYEFVINDDGKASNMTWQEALDLTAHSAIRSIANLKQLVLIGHTDSLGSDAYNERLGLQRAEFVASELVKRGVPKALIRVRSLGRTQPVMKRPEESDEQFRLRSRRAEFIKVFK